MFAVVFRKYLKIINRAFPANEILQTFYIFSQRRKLKVTQVSGTSDMYLGFCQNIYDEAFSPEIVKVILNPPEK